jgi:hypothetical protein
MGAVIRTAAVDLYYNSVRLVTANVVWGLTLLGVLFAVTRLPLLAPLVLVVIPVTMGLMGMATTLVRLRRVFWSDFTDAVRRRFLPLFGVGVVQLVIVIVAAVDAVIGVQTPGVLGPVLLITSLYTLVGLWIVSITTWPLLLDPLRADDGVRPTLRLGLLLAVAHPVRMAGLALVLGVLLVASTVVAAALVTVSGALVMLIAAHYVLPAADRLEGRATLDVEED